MSASPGPELGGDRLDLGPIVELAETMTAGHHPRRAELRRHIVEADHGADRDLRCVRPGSMHEFPPVVCVTVKFLGLLAGADVHHLRRVQPVPAAVRKEYGVRERGVALVVEHVEERRREQPKTREPDGVRTNESLPGLAHALRRVTRRNPLGIRISRRAHRGDRVRSKEAFDDQATISVEGSELRLERVVSGEALQRSDARRGHGPLCDRKRRSVEIGQSPH